MSSDPTEIETKQGDINCSFASLDHVRPGKVDEGPDSNSDQKDTEAL
jgi:hypothetical protein